MQPDGENQPIKKPRGMHHDVKVTIGNRIKRACVKSGAWHGFLRGGWAAVGTVRLAFALIRHNT